MKPTAWWELDHRSLAVFRMVLGGFVLLDTLLRLPYLQDFMTDDGVLPRMAVVSGPLSDTWISLHLATGTWFGQMALSVYTGLFAVGLIVGWRTPWMAAGCWYMVNSLQARNPFVCDRGDMQLSLLLFWAIFLPLGACWSLDHKHGRKPWGKPRGVAAAGLVLQFAWIYLFAGLLKSGDFWLSRGDGLKFSLLSPNFATPLATKLSHLSAFSLMLGNYAVIVGELFVGFLILCPFMVPLMRQAAVGLLALFHLSVLLLFQLGLFPWIGALTPVALLPREFWERLGRASSESAESKPWPRPVRAFLVACMVLSLLSNLSFNPIGTHLVRPAWVTHLTERLRLEQHWELFAPLPPVNGTFRLAVEEPDGRQVVLFEGPPTATRPDLQHYPSHRWKMLMLSTLFPEFASMREPVARVLARKYAAPKGKIQYTFLLNPISDRGEFKQPELKWLWFQR